MLVVKIVVRSVQSPFVNTADDQVYGLIIRPGADISLADFPYPILVAICEVCFR